MNELRKAFTDAFRLYGFDPASHDKFQTAPNGQVVDTTPYEDALFELWRVGYEAGARAFMNRTVPIEGDKPMG